MSSISVSTNAQFQTAIARANASGSAGETIVLQAGVYQGLDVSGYAGAGPLLIELASAANPAVVEGMTVEYSSNITLANLSFSNRNVAHGLNNNVELSIGESSNVTVKNDQFSGASSTTLAANSGKGIYMRDDTNVSVASSSFQYLLSGIQNMGDNGVADINNSMSNIFDDGIDTSGTSNITISGNSFTTFHTDATDGGHPDAIQFWTTGVSSNSSNITVTNNTISRGAGAPIQGVFITSQNNYRYSNVNVSNNSVTGEMSNGIWVDSSSNIDVAGNVIQPFTDQISRLILTDDTGGTVGNNKIGTAMVSLGLSGVSLSNNSMLAAVAAFVASAGAIPPHGALTESQPATAGGAAGSVLASPHG